MASEFTKGPWTTAGHFIYGPNDEEIAELSNADNCYVIAAAPEMLATLKSMRSTLLRLGGDPMPTLDAVIAKAEATNGY